MAAETVAYRCVEQEHLVPAHHWNPFYYRLLVRLRNIGLFNSFVCFLLSLLSFLSTLTVAIATASHIALLCVYNWFHEAWGSELPQGNNARKNSHGLHQPIKNLALQKWECLSIVTTYRVHGYSLLHPVYGQYTLIQCHFYLITSNLVAIDMALPYVPINILLFIGDLSSTPLGSYTNRPWIRYG